jgi:hypothetical protein
MKRKKGEKWNIEEKGKYREKSRRGNKKEKMGNLNEI